MLVLSRKQNEKVRIGDEVEVVIVEIRGDKVRLGIHAPSDVPVHREEVYRAIERQGGNRRFAHLYSGQDYLGPTKCRSKAQADAVVATHMRGGRANWGMVTASEDPPLIDKSTLSR